MQISLYTRFIWSMIMRYVHTRNSKDMNPCIVNPPLKRMIAREGKTDEIFLSCSV